MNFRFLLACDYRYPGEVLIYDDNVSILSPDRREVINIQNGDFATLQKNLFDSAVAVCKVLTMEKEHGKSNVNQKHPVLAKAEKRFWKV